MTKMQIGKILLLLGTLGLHVQPAFADCKAAKNAIFTDNFTDNLGGWDADSQGFASADGVGTLTILKDTGARGQLNNSFMVREAHFCVDVTFYTEDTAGKDNPVAAGLQFGAVDYTSYYVFVVSSQGAYMFLRRNNGQWNTVIKFTASPAVKPGLGAQNTVEVLIKAGVATLMVNQQKVNAVRVQLPDGDSKFGVFASHDPIGSDMPVQFRHFVVNPPDP